MHANLISNWERCIRIVWANSVKVTWEGVVQTNDKVNWENSLHTHRASSSLTLLGQICLILYMHTFQVEAARKWCKFMRESCELLVFNVLLYFLQSCALIKLVHVRVFTKARRSSWIGKTSNATSNYPLPIS